MIILIYRSWFIFIVAAYEFQFNFDHKRIFYRIFIVALSLSQNCLDTKSQEWVNSLSDFERKLSSKFLYNSLQLLFWFHFIRFQAQPVEWQGYSVVILCLLWFDFCEGLIANQAASTLCDDWLKHFRRVCLRYTLIMKY